MLIDVGDARTLSVVSFVSPWSFLWGECPAFLAFAAIFNGDFPVFDGEWAFPSFVGELPLLFLRFEPAN